MFMLFNHAYNVITTDLNVLVATFFKHGIKKLVQRYNNMSRFVDYATMLKINHNRTYLMVIKSSFNNHLSVIMANQRLIKNNPRTSEAEIKVEIQIRRTLLS